MRICAAISCAVLACSALATTAEPPRREFDAKTGRWATGYTGKVAAVQSSALNLIAQDERLEYLRRDRDGSVTAARLAELVKAIAAQRNADHTDENYIALASEAKKLLEDVLSSSVAKGEEVLAIRIKQYTTARSELAAKDIPDALRDTISSADKIAAGQPVKAEPAAKKTAKKNTN